MNLLGAFIYVILVLVIQKCVQSCSNGDMKMKSLLLLGLLVINTGASLGFHENLDGLCAKHVVHPRPNGPSPCNPMPIIELGVCCTQSALEKSHS